MPSDFQSKLYRGRDLAFSITISSILLPIKWSSIFIILFALFFIATVPFSEMKTNWRKNRFPLFLFLGFFVFNGLSLFYSDNISHALKDIEGKLSLVIFPLILLGQDKMKTQEFQRAGLFFAVSVLLACIVAVVLSFAEYHSLLSNQELSGLIGLHASYFGLYVAFSFFIVLKSYLEGKAWWKVIALVFFFLALIFIAARIILLGFIFGIFIWFLSRRFNLKRVALSFLGLLLMVLVLAAFPPVQKRFFEAIDSSDKVKLDVQATAEDSLLGPYGGRAIRIAIWDCSWDVIKENYLFGVGIGDVHEALQKSYKNRGFIFAWKYNNYNAHNLWIETTIAFGLIGLVFLIAIFSFLFHQAFSKKNLLLFSFSFLFFALSLMESSFNVHRGLVFFAAFSSFLLLQVSEPFKEKL